MLVPPMLLPCLLSLVGAAASTASGPTSATYPTVDEEKLRGLLAQMSTEEQFLQTCIDNECAESQVNWFRCNPFRPPNKNQSSAAESSIFASLSPAAGDVAFELRSNERLGIRGMRLRDGPKGMTCNGFGSPCPEDGTAPAFPAQSLRACSWDVELEQEFGEAIGEIASRLDIHAALLPTINILPWLNWGRAQESFGEDPFFNGRMGAAVVRGVQKEGKVMATAKHFLANNIENSRWWVSAEMDEKLLHEVYLKAWAMIVAESAPELVMTSYNRVQGKYAFADPKFIDILRGKLGFQGSVMTDWIATWEAITSGLLIPGGDYSPYWKQVGFLKPASIYHAGVDMEMPYCSKNRDAVSQLQACALADEEACTAKGDLHRAAGRLLRSKMRYGLVGAQPPNSPRVKWDNEKYGELALRIAQQGMVLLRNEGGFLPKPPKSVRSVAVLGPADVTMEGDKGSSNVKPSIEPVPVLSALKEKYGAENTYFFSIEDSLERQEELVRQADMVVVSVGYSFLFEGEFIPPSTGGDRRYLHLHEEHIAWIHWAAGLNDRVVVLITSGANVVVEQIVDKVKAILWVGYPGPMGGPAAVGILAGDVNPSGRLTSVTPKDAADYVPNGTNLEPWHSDPAPAYPYLHGFKHMWANGIEPRYPLGFGLSYTTFAHAAPILSYDSSTLTATVRAGVTNTGARDGIETVQVYVTCETCKQRRMPIVLAGFAKVRLAAGASGESLISFSAREMAVYVTETGRWLLEAGRYRVLVGPCADRASLQGADLAVEAEVVYDYPLADPAPDAFSGPHPGAECGRCAPEAEKIAAWALPSEKTWHLLMSALLALRFYLRHQRKLAALGLCCLLACLWCCCCRCCRRAAARAGSKKEE